MMKVNKITTTSNYTFLNETYREAKRGLAKERRKQIELNDLMYVDKKRLRGVGLEGGSRSGKTWDTSVFMCEYMNTFSGKTILIGRDMLTRLKGTVYQTFKKVWGNFYGDTIGFNKSATPLEYNGNTIFFKGVNEDAMLAHGFETDIVWINEAMNCRKETVDELIRRCNEFYILDYNPSAVNSWCFDMEKRDSHKIHFSSALTNRYCPPNARIEILGYEPTHPADRHLPEDERREHPVNVKNGTADLYKWKVYGLGERGKSEDLVFSEYGLFDDESRPKDEEFDYISYGGDFGDSAPNVLVKVMRRGNELYLEEMFRYYLDHTSELTTAEQLTAQIDAKGIKKTRQIWDSAEKKTIRDLKINGVMALPARKGVDSVKYGVRKMRNSKVYIHKDSTDLQMEFDSYVWAKMANGEFMTDKNGDKVPKKGNDHGIDAARYADSWFNYSK